ncbi:MAG: hypothetical protein Ct9H300mP14_15110 [Gammaproteobacteria bacterium]|nr:MAG: hypothetical protein Ct9H300mP14_15110 [Gammaproteobacteria bacterium]
MIASRAAVAHEAGKPLSIETVNVDGPREGEVLIEIRGDGNMSHRCVYPVWRRPGRTFPSHTRTRRGGSGG